ncbi:arginase family protein [Candidatus Woesearchaeota archaeon]|nr:arginase family protein [Candidatus Woesearchaeota archaeon]
MKLIKIPSSLGSLKKNTGTEKAPDLIVDGLKEFYCAENGRIPTYAIHEVKVSKNLSETHEAVQKFFETVDSYFVAIGGDHSTTYGIASALKPALLVFDAHPDLMQKFDPPTHENYLRCLIENSFVDKSKIVLVGLRNWDKEEYDYLIKNKINFFSMKSIAEDEIIDACNDVMSAVKDFKRLMISLDIDVLDPAFAPGTGYQEPGGLTSRELFYFIHRLKNLKNIIGWDLVEVNPDKDINNLTVKTASKLIFEIIS